MFLHDQVMEAGSARFQTTTTAPLPTAALWATAVAAAPIRYVLSDEVRDECIAIACTRKALLEPTAHTPRVPHETMWIEWRDRQKSSLSTTRPGRVGILVRSDVRGRSGTAHVVYEFGNGPLMAQMRVDFDFDNPRENVGELLTLAFPGEPQNRGAGMLLRHCRFSVERPWREYLSKAERQGELSQEMLVVMARAAVPDFVFLSTFLLLLDVERMLDRRPSDLSKVNKARARAGRHPLLDHVDVHLSLSAKEGGRRGAGERAASRLHQVRGHLVRRSGKTLWRTTHLRGDAASGMIASRTIHVSR